MIPRICRTKHTNIFSFSSRSHSSQAPNPRWSKPRKVALRVFKVANFVFAVHLFATHVGRPSFMGGVSMLPTLSGEPSEIVVEEMLTHTLFPNSFLNRGDLVTFISPIGRDRLVCKRLIGMPGDIVCVDPTGEYASPSEHIVVPKGHIWVSGDNMTASRDSRHHGPVPLALVKGRVVARIWPPSQLAIFRSGITYLE